MQMKGVIFGFGIGMVFLSAIFLIAFRYESRQAGISDYAVSERAAEMGMVWPTDDVAEVVRKALELGMVFDIGGTVVDEVEDDEE